MTRAAWLAGAALCAAAALGAGALSQAYRGTVVRVLRERHPTEWERAGRPSAGGPRGELGLLSFARSRRYWALNDADLVSEARNFYYNRLAAYLLAAASVAALGLAWRAPR